MPIDLFYRIDDLLTGAGRQRYPIVPPVLSRTPPPKPYDVEERSTERAVDHLFAEARR
ncbi:hypothetical protein [Marichromatium gracile]|uniref:hypothetical protein n=1 Tax=Marichromatium gracile TaxID=1048 RepID=UPI0013654C32|nr:hypothetical protein [Marichromatium gracile]